MREVRLRMSAGLRDQPHVVMSSWRGVSGRRYVVIVHDLADAGTIETPSAVVLGVRRRTARPSFTSTGSPTQRPSATPWCATWSTTMSEPRHCLDLWQLLDVYRCVGEIMVEAALQMPFAMADVWAQARRR
ncbi:hypothetical protein [Methylobacterium sp. WL120]|uniref:hypothetical protein n=1 Tax=unclassified Methylobacterium TaxID=2615210 RepID=UPI0032B25A41